MKVESRSEGGKSKVAHGEERNTGESEIRFRLNRLFARLSTSTVYASEGGGVGMRTQCDGVRYETGAARDGAGEHTAGNVMDEREKLVLFFDPSSNRSG